MSESTVKPDKKTKDGGDLDLEVRKRFLENSRKSFLQPGERFVGYYTKLRNQKDEVGDMNFALFSDEHRYRISSGTEFVTIADPTRVMDEQEYIRSISMGSYEPGTMSAYAVYEKVTEE